MGQVPGERLFLIDAFGFIFRAYHARARSGAPPMRTSTGFSTEAVYIFNNMVRKLTREYQPTHIAAVFESGEPTHRLEEFAEYKANRAETPPDLLEQSRTCAGCSKRCASRCSNMAAMKPTM